MRDFTLIKWKLAIDNFYKVKFFKNKVVFNENDVIINKAVYQEQLPNM